MFGAHTYNKTDYSCGNVTIFEGCGAIRVRCHANIVLLARGRFRIPHDPPSAIRREGWPGRRWGEAGCLHLECEVARMRRLRDGNVVNCERGRGLSLGCLFGMIWRRFLENQTGASVANKRRGKFVVRAGTTGAVEGDYRIKIRLGRI